MKSVFTLFFLIFFLGIANSQQITLVTPLNDSIQETSGLLYLNQKIITHNDSGGEAILYELDSVSGNVTREIVISNATNVDWEDLCYDDTFIYIADIGNNNGTRTNLTVYKILISDYFNTTNDTVTANFIDFNYSDQTDFSSSPFATNFDAEAIISMDDSLYVFTKNWGNNWSNIYALPKVPGTHQITKIDSINAQGLVTGATFDSISNTIMLSGYTFTTPFTVELSGFTDHDFSSGTINRQVLQLPSGYSFQIESIVPINQSQYYLTAEGGISGTSALFRLNPNYDLGTDFIDETTATIYPNPSSGVINIRSNDTEVVEIYDLQGILQKTSKKTQISVSDLSKGVYLVILKNAEEKINLTTKIIIQ